MENPSTPAVMPVFHIMLDCATPTSHVDGAFRTLVAVTDAEQREGAHFREAARRASIIGFGGPHRVVAVAQLDAIAPEETAHLAARISQRPAPSMSERLESLLALGTGAVHDVSESDTNGQPTGALPPQIARRARSRGL